MTMYQGESNINLITLSVLSPITVKLNLDLEVSHDL